MKGEWRRHLLKRVSISAGELIAILKLGEEQNFDADQTGKLSYFTLHPSYFTLHSSIAATLLEFKKRDGDRADPAKEFVPHATHH